jgi:LmbE family N-acetylglucosaminyl deacetylase
MKSLLCVTAHPDDEAWAFGGSLWLYQERGVETSVICFTRGGAGTYKGGAKSSAEQRSIRAQEFADACRLLRVTHADLLDYPDGGLAGLNFYETIADLSGRLRTLRPDVVITFGTEGTVTAHPDHSMVALFTTAACQWAGRQDRFREQLRDGLRPHRVQKLYYVSAREIWPERPPISPAPITAAIDVHAFVDKKVEAFKAHQSQAPLVSTYQRVLRSPYEYYHLAASITPRQAESESDLFAGIENAEGN